MKSAGKTGFGIFTLILAILMCSACTNKTVNTAAENKEAAYTDDGTDLIYAVEAATNKTCLITTDGEIAAEVPADAYYLGMGMIFVPETGVINLEGELLFAPKCDWMSEYADGLAPFGYISDNGMRAGYLDTAGKIAIEPVFCSATSFSDGFAAVQLSEDDKGGEWGYINTSGEIVYRGFADAAPFSDGLALVSYDNEKYGYIRTDGEFAAVILQEFSPILGEAG